MLRDILLREAILFGFLFTRITGFILTSPFPGEHIPKTARLALAITLSFFVRTIMKGNPPPPELGLDTILALTGELAIGALIGFVFRLLVAAGDMAGELISQATGLSSASVMNPMFGPHETVITRLFSSGTLLLVLTSGTHRVVLAYLIDSFAAMPLGTHLQASGALEPLLDLFVDSLALGVRLAMPVVAMSVLVQVALAMVARIAPSLQIFNVGFAILIAAGLFTMAMTMKDVTGWLIHHVSQAPDAIDRVFRDAT